MTTSEVADTYVAFRAKHDVAEAAAKTMAECSVSEQDLVDSLGAEILNGSRPDFQAMQGYRNEVLSPLQKGAEGQRDEVTNRSTMSVAEAASGAFVLLWNQEGSAMNYNAFVQLLTTSLPAGLVMNNPGRGTSTVVWCNAERICYMRGGLKLYVQLADLYEGYRQHIGQVLTTNDLKAMNPAIFDTKQNGHDCHCTFLFMALRQMGLVDEIQGAGRAGRPFAVSL